MLLGEPDRAETQPDALDASFARPFQNGLFVDMQTGGDGAFVEQGRFNRIHGRSGSQIAPRPVALRRAFDRKGSGAYLDDLVTIRWHYIEPRLGLSPTDHPLVVLGDDPD